MATIESIYLGGLRTEATHVQSGVKIITDAPVDNRQRRSILANRPAIIIISKLYDDPNGHCRQYSSY